MDSRIKENPAVFAKLDAATQSKIKQGIVDPGFKPDMVYLALGAPDEKRVSLSAASTKVIWIYNRYHERHGGMRHIGYHRGVYFDPRLPTHRVYYKPVLRDMHTLQKDERIRVVLKDGKAAVIEQTKDY